MSLVTPVGWLLLLLGVLLAVWDKRGGRRRRAPSHWDDVEGRIVSARVVPVGDVKTASGLADALWTAEVVYDYPVRSARQEGRQTRFHGRDATTFAEAERVVASYPAGAPVEVAVDPADPTQAMLAYDPPNRALLGVGLVIAVIGMLVLMAR